MFVRTALPMIGAPSARMVIPWYGLLVAHSMPHNRLLTLHVESSTAAVQILPQTAAYRLEYRNSA